MSNPVNYNNLRRPKTRSTANERTPKKNASKEKYSTDTTQDLVDNKLQSNKKKSIPNLDLFSNNDTIVQPFKSSTNPTNLKTYGGKASSQSTTRTTTKVASTTIPPPPTVVIHPKTTSATVSKTTSKSAQGSKETVEGDDYAQEVGKLIKICQKNSLKIDDIKTKQDKLEKVVSEQSVQISEILSILKDSEKKHFEIEMKGKGKGKTKKADEFYQSAVKNLAYELFHEHKQPTEQDMRRRVKEKLEADEYCVSFLQKLEEKGLTFDALWSQKIYSAMLAAIRTKKGYYVRRVKDGLWATFGINRIKPFKDNYTTQQIKEWKQSKNAQSVYNDLYISSNPEDDEADTYLTLIIKYVFTAEKERTSSNGLWVQSVLESIFDKTHLSTKIESEIIDTWIDAITDTEMESNEDNNSPAYSPDSSQPVNNPSHDENLMMLDDDNDDFTMPVDDVLGC